MKVLWKRQIESKNREYHVCACVCWGGETFWWGQASYVRKGGRRWGLRGRLKSITEERACADTLTRAGMHAWASDQCLGDDHELWIIIAQPVSEVCLPWHATQNVVLNQHHLNHLRSCYKYEFMEPNPDLGICALTSPPGDPDAHCSS